MFLIVLVVSILVIITGLWLWFNNHKAADNSLANIKNKGVLVVGGYIPYGVMEFFDANNKAAGIDVDIAAEIASQLGVRLEFNDYDWDKIFPLVKNGQIDLAISSITITPERQKEMLFSNPYFNGGQVIVINVNNQEIKGINDLFGQKIAVQRDSTGYNEAKKYTSENSIFTYLNFNASADGQSIINDLANKKFAAIIVDYIQALTLIKNYPNLKIVGVPFTKEDYGLATKIGNNSLMEKINSILQNMKKNGTLEKIETKWTRL